MYAGTMKLNPMDTANSVSQERIEPPLTLIGWLPMPE